MTLTHVSLLAFAAPFVGACLGQMIALGPTHWAARMSAEVFPACPTEDSVLCVWNAKTQGNGRGQSFLALSDSLIFALDL